MQLPTPEEHIEVGGAGEIESERYYGAVSADPKRTAIDPFRSLALQALGKHGKVIGKQDVVVSNEADKLTPGLLQRNIAVGIAEIGSLRQIEPANARIGEARNHVSRVIGAAIADDQKLEILLGLPEHRPDRISDDVGPIVRGQQHAKARRHLYQPR